MILVDSGIPWSAIANNMAGLASQPVLFACRFPLYRTAAGKTNTKTESATHMANFIHIVRRKR